MKFSAWRAKIAGTGDDSNMKIIDAAVGELQESVDGVMQDVESAMNDKADKTDTVLNTTLSMGRKAGITVGAKSVALGDEVSATGNMSYAEGYNTAAIGEISHAEGNGTLASGEWSHAEGNNTQATGGYSHAEGGTTHATAFGAHSEGAGTTASGAGSHAEGGGTTASGDNSHAEGSGTRASNNCSHAEGIGTTASGVNAHAEGGGTSASGSQSHAEGGGTTASGSGSHAEGSATTASGENSHAEGYNSESLGSYSHAEGYQTKANSSYAHSEGAYSTADSPYSHAEGHATYAKGPQAHAEGYGSNNNSIDVAGDSYIPGAYGNASHSEGYLTMAADLGSHSEGCQTQASNTSHAEGYQTKATGEGAHAEGYRYNKEITISSNKYLTGARAQASHSEGYNTCATNYYSHAEGYQTVASGSDSHAEGYETVASGMNSHAEGYNTAAIGENSHAEGGHTIASRKTQHVFGKYNIQESGNSTTEGLYAEIVGNGTEQSRSNARTLDWSGNEWISGSLKLGSSNMSQTVSGHGIAIGDGSTATHNSGALAVGGGSRATGYGAIATGGGSLASGDYSSAMGGSVTASGSCAHAEGSGTTASDANAHAEGGSTTASGAQAHAEGGSTTASGLCAHAEGGSTTASGSCAHAEGSNTVANHNAQHVFGEYNIPDDSSAESNERGNYVEIVGNGTYNARSNARMLDWNGNEWIAGSLKLGSSDATGSSAIAAGNGSLASGNNSSAIGYSATASGVNAHAEGGTTTASNVNAHAEGGGTTASGPQAHAEGGSTTASGINAHAEGGDTVASGFNAHAEGTGTVANHMSQHVFGEFNVPDNSEADSYHKGNYVEIVGNGTNNTRSNARTLDWNGNETLAGDLKIKAGTSDEISVLQLAQTVAAFHDEIDNWSTFKKLVKAGLIQEYAPVGSQISDTWENAAGGTNYDAPWDVVHHGADGTYLEQHYATPDGVPFDEPEAIYYAAAGGLPAGTYHIDIGVNFGSGWVAGKAIKFTLANAMVEGDQLVIDCGTNNANNPTNGRTWNVYAKGSTVSKEHGTTSNGTGGTSLGTIGATNAHTPSGQLNAVSRVVYGYNRWSQSAMRQYLNSTAAAGDWWTPQNDWDRPPAAAATLRGWLAGCSEDFLNILEPVEVVTALNNFDSSGSVTTETTTDRIFLKSLQETYITPQFANVEGKDWDYYKTLAQEAGLSGKFLQGNTYPILISHRLDDHSSPVVVRLRSCNRPHAHYVWFVNFGGMVGGGSGASEALRGRPACKISKS